MRKEYDELSILRANVISFLLLNKYSLDMVGSGIMKNEKVIASIIFIIVSGLFFALSLDFPSVAQPNDVGPAFIPRISAGFLTLLSIILFIQGIIEIKNKEQESESLYHHIFLVLVVMILTILYVFLIPILGFYIVSGLFIIIYLILSKIRKVSLILAIAIGTNLFVYLFFELTLKVPVPSGILF